MARNPDLWENPLEFIPERFNVETTAERMNPYTYIPFSAGSRNCIGQKFAILEVKSTVSKILRNFKLSAGENSETLDSLELVIKSKNGVQILLQNRLYD
jgi:cytochrome P450 family 4